ncbi:hypothetical protein EJ08DRAFT_703920 [Tothia fuscella]|uniref:Uncharacterized protein n=1 Tax=Tothia fuscella TaxID=1048955 RepID=A0A9P4NDS3_9PEZI|nr:hypothetical protein EJ08DRAFT_703920 [Tothia fuscella]
MATTGNDEQRRKDTLGHESLHMQPSPRFYVDSPTCFKIEDEVNDRIGTGRCHDAHLMVPESREDKSNPASDTFTPPPTLPPSSPGPPASREPGPEVEPHIDAHIHEARASMSCPRCEPLVQVHKHLSQERQRIFMTRTRLEVERKNLKQLRIMSRDKQTKSLSCLDGAMNRGLHKDDQFSLQELNRDAQDSFRDLCRHEDHCIELENTLSRLEYETNKREQECYQNDFYAASGTSSSKGSKHSAKSHATSSRTIENLPPILKEYYNKFGDAKVFQERIQNFNFDHQRTLRTRTKNASAGKRVKPAEQVFWKSYFRERKQHIQAYLEAKADAQRLRKLCAELNYQIEPEDDIDFADRVPEVDATKKDLQELSHDVSSGPPRPLELLLFGDMDAQGNVQDWLKDTLKSTVAIGPSSMQAVRGGSEGGGDAQAELAPDASQAQTEPQRELSSNSPTFPTVPATLRLSKRSSRVARFYGETLTRRYSEPELTRIVLSEDEDQSGAYRNVT